MGLFGSVGKFFSKAASTAGRAVHSVGKTIGKAPVVGKPLHAAFDYTYGAPIQMAVDIVNGRRVDRAVIGRVRQQVQDIKVLAPYIQTVVSAVPGIGQGASGIIGASLTLAEGRPITEAIKNGVIDAVPGGAAARAVASASFAIMQGQRVDKAALSAIPLPPEQKNALGDALTVINDAANKKKVSPEVLQSLVKSVPGGMAAIEKYAKENDIPVPVAAAEKVLKSLPPDLRNAAKVGASLGHAKTLQKMAAHAAVQSIPHLEKMGAGLMTPELKEVARLAGGPTGVQIGAALMAHSGVSPSVISRVRKNLGSSVDRKGFDMALASHIGKVTAPNRAGSPAQLAGYYVTRGMGDASRKQRNGMLKSIMKSTDARKGAVVASSEMQSEGVWPKILKYFGFKA